MKTTPMNHQAEAVARSTKSRQYAFLMEMGTGKTWTAICDAEMLFNANHIDAMLVCAPNGVHKNWVLREIPTHMSLECRSLAWDGKPTTKKAKAAWESLIDTRLATRTMRVFSINIDAFNTPAGKEYVEKFLKTFRCAFYVDESTRIKNPQAARTKSVIKLGKLAVARRILSGSPITKSPIDMYCQFDFLKPGLLGTTSYRAFVAEYAHLMPADSPQMQAIMRQTGARVAPQIVLKDSNGRPMWKNLNRLSSLIAPHSSRVRKEDCLDLPPKVREQIVFELSPDQRKMYDHMRDEYEFATDLDCVTFEAIAARSKMKQITSGFINIEGEPVMMPDADNPRLAAFKQLLDTFEEELDDDSQFIVWTTFGIEHDSVCKELTERKISFVEYVGSTKSADRDMAIDEFQAGRVRAFVANPQAAGIGLTLTAAENVIYYSTDFDLEKRWQSEDRAHRKGQTKTVTYWDLIAKNTIDEDQVKSINTKSLTAHTIMDDVQRKQK